MPILQDAADAGVSIGLGIGTVGLLGAQLREGVLYSAGIEMPVGYKNAPVFSTGGSAGYRYANLFLNTSSLDFTATTPAHLMSLEEGALKSPVGDPSRTLTNKVMPGGKGLPAIAIGSTAIFGAMRYADEGSAGLGNFLIEDFFSQYYGNKASEIRGIVGNLSRAANFAGVTEGALANAGVTTASEMSYYRSIGGSVLAGRMLPILGAYSGAAPGLAAGQAIGSGLGQMLGSDSKSFGLVGGIFGAAAGARMGAAAASSLPALAISGLAVGGAMLATNTVGNILKTGFQNNRTRGLDFAGDMAAYYNNASVTMRQRAVQAMHKSHLNARSALGQEASIMHMNRDYFANRRRL